MLFVTKDALSQLGAVAGIIVFIMSIFFIKQIRSDTKLDLPVELLTKISSSSKVKAVCRRQNRLQVGGGNIMKYLKKFKSLEATNE